MSKIEKIISIGASCDAMFLSSHLNLREKGPVDNMVSSFKYVYKLFNNDFQKSIINDNYKFTEKHDWDSFEGCIFDGYEMIHNDFKSEKTKIELCNRIQLFNEYCKNAITNNNYFFMYCTSHRDHWIEPNEIVNTFIMLPGYVKKRLLFINGRMTTDNFNKNFNINYPVFIYDTELLRKPENNKDVINKFSEFWINNKNFYEKLNNCKYNDI